MPRIDLWTIIACQWNGSCNQCLPERLKDLTTMGSRSNSCWYEYLSRSKLFFVRVSQSLSKPRRELMLREIKIMSAAADTLDPFLDAEIDFEAQYGAPFYLSHRVDLHSELKHLATREEGPGSPAKIILKSEVIDVVSLRGCGYIATHDTL